MTVEDRIEYLRNELHRHNYNYYVLNSPLISDKEFDDMMRELQDLEQAHPELQDDNSPTVRVGSDINKNFTQVVHQYPMLSLGNTYSEDEVSDFYDRVAKAINEDFEICCELKYDGTSISLIYENGKLIRAVTRGDGEKGDDVTENDLKINATVTYNDIQSEATVTLTITGDGADTAIISYDNVPGLERINDTTYRCTQNGQYTFRVQSADGRHY